MKLPKFSFSPGFTMIELLVVIAVIGVLAVAVLSSINPIEQINKGRDTRLRSNAAQMLNAIDRFYAIQEIYPWNDATYGGGTGGATPTDTLPNTAFPDGTVCADAGPDEAIGCQLGGVGYAAGSQEWLTALSETEEVKESFINNVEKDGASDGMYVYKAADDDVYICFHPSSKQFELEALEGCVDRASILPPGACPQDTYTDASPFEDEMICLP